MSSTTLVTGKDLDAAVAERVVGINPRAETPAEIGEAVFSAMWSSFPQGKDGTVQKYTFNGTEYAVSMIGSKFNYGGAHGNDGYGLWVWEDRHGREYQADIEAHVAQWRKRPAAYSTDLLVAWRVVDKMRADGWRFVLDSEGADTHAWWVSFEKGRALFTEANQNLPEAICRAALRAVGAAADG